MKVTTIDRIKNQRYICNEIFWLFRTGKLQLSTMQLAFVYGIYVAEKPVDYVQLGVLRSFMQRTGHGTKLPNPWICNSTNHTASRHKPHIGSIK